MNIEFIRKHHEFMRLQVVMRKPNTGEPLDPVWIIIFGHKLRPFPHPADLMEPAANGFCGHRDAVFGLKRRRECRTTPSRAAPAIRPWGGLEQGPKRAREPRRQDTRCNSDRELTIWVNTDAEAPRAIRPHDAVHTGA